MACISCNGSPSK
ncbi:hypothetical protein YPPY06_2717, partial [Yersinia pestis PY-06]